MKNIAHQLKLIAKISLPAVVTNVTTPVLGLSDVAISGHMGSSVYVAAIAVGATIFNLMFWLCGFLRMGTSGLTAQAYGSNNTRLQQITLNRGLFLGLAIGTIIVVAQRPICTLMLYAMDVDGATAEVVRRYFNIVVYCAPAQLSLMSLTGWCVGMQDSRLPMWTSFFIDVFNIALSVALVFGAGMKIEGVAIGTLSAQWAGLLLCLWLVKRRYGLKLYGASDIVDGIGRFFKVNRDIFLRTVCLVAVTLWFTRAGSQQGTDTLAANSLLMQLFTLFSFVVDGIGFASEALCGKYYGRGDNANLQLSVRCQFLVAICVAFVFTAIYFLFTGDVLTLLSSDAGVVDNAKSYAMWAVCIPLVSFAAFVWDGVFIGITRTKMMLLSMAVAASVFFLLYFLLEKSLGNNGLWIAFLSYLFTRGIVLGIAWHRIQNSHNSHGKM